MKLLPLSKARPGEFEGRTFEEALHLARLGLGENAPIRCWRVLRGGVFGFFAKESFIAGLSVPAGADLSHSRYKGRETSSSEATSHLYDLVNATADEVCLGSELDLNLDFSKVLAEVEAALIDAAATELELPKPVVRPSDISAEKIAGLCQSLLQLGVPNEYLPEEESLDYLVRSLSRLPPALPIRKIDGSLLVVVGPQRDALATARHVVDHLGLTDADLIVGERNSSARQRVTRRRSAKKMTVLVVEASLRSRELDQVAAWIQSVQPDYVIAALPMSVKRKDFEPWRARLGRIDALALTIRAGSGSLCELMGVLPIALLDGAPATTLRWVAVLINLVLGVEN